MVVNLFYLKCTANINSIFIFTNIMDLIVKEIDNDNQVHCLNYTVSFSNLLNDFIPCALPTKMYSRS